MQTITRLFKGTQTTLSSVRAPLRGTFRASATVALIVLVCTAPVQAQLAPVLGREPPVPSASGPPSPPGAGPATDRVVGLADRYVPPPTVGDPIVDHLGSAPTGPGDIHVDTANTTRNASELADHLEQVVFGDPAGDVDGDGRRSTTPAENHTRAETGSLVENTTTTAGNLTQASGPGDIQDNATRYAGYLVAGIGSGGDFDGDGNDTSDAASKSRQAAEEDAASLDENASRVAGNATGALEGDLESTTGSGAGAWATNTTPIDATVENVTESNLSRDVRDGDVSHLRDNATWAADRLGAWGGALSGWGIDLAGEAIRSGRVTARLVQDLDDGPDIRDVRLTPDRPVQGDDATVRARIEDPNTVAGAEVRWQTPDGTRAVPMSNVQGRTWQADITVEAPDTSEIAYRVVAWDDGAAGDAPDRDPRLDRDTYRDTTGRDAPGSNRSDLRRARVADRTPPHVEVTTDTLPAVPWELTIHAVDRVGAGPVQVEVEIPLGNETVRRSSTADSPIHRIDLPVLPVGDHDLRVVATDAAGNRRTVRTTLPVIEIAPALPLDVGDLDATDAEPHPSDGDDPSDADPSAPDTPDGAERVEESASRSRSDAGGGQPASIPGPGWVVAVVALGAAWVVVKRW